EDQRVAEAALAAFEDRERDRRDRGRQEQRAREVGPGVLGLLAAGVGQDLAAPEVGEGADGEVDVEGPAPARAGDERGAQRRAGPDRERADAAPERDHLAAPLARDRIEEQADRSRKQEGGAGALERPPRDQQRDAGREAAKGRAEEKAGEAGEEDTAEAEAVAAPAADDEERAEDDRVGGHDPGEVGAAGLRKGLRHRRERHVDDREIERDQEGPERRHGEHIPTLLHATHYRAVDFMMQLTILAVWSGRASRRCAARLRSVWR